MKYDEFKEMCHKTWSESFIYLCIDMTEKTRVNIVFSLIAKPHILIAFLKPNLLKKHTNTLKCTCS